MASPNPSASASKPQRPSSPSPRPVLRLAWLRYAVFGTFLLGLVGSTVNRQFVVGTDVYLERDNVAFQERQEIERRRLEEFKRSRGYDVDDDVLVSMLNKLKSIFG